MTTYHDGMELGDWQRGAQEAARFDIGLSKVSLQDTPLPSTWDIAKQNFVDSHRTQNIAAAAQNLNTTFDEVNDKIKAATGVSDLFNPMISEASPFMPVKMPDGKLPARPDGDLFEAWKARVRELRTTHPDALNWDEIETEPERRAYQIMKETRERTNTMSQRLGLIEPGQIPYIGNIPLVGATAALGANMMTSPIAAAAQFAGGMAGTITSPVDTAVNLFAGAAGNQAKSIVSNAMKNAYINALAQAPLSAAKQYDYEKAGLPTGWRVWLSEVEGAAAAGFLLDAGVRAPVRAARRAMGAQDLGGVFLDAVPRANLAERPEGMAPIDPKVFEAAASGDLKATREILEKSGALEDPAIRGALDHMETGAKMDAVMIERLKEMGVAESEGFRILSNLLEGGYARAPDRLAADVDAMRNPPQPALKSADVDRVLSVSRAALDQLRADLPQMVEMAVEARIPEVESVIRTAIKSLGEAKPDPARISKQVADEISAVLSDPKTGPRVADTVRITSGAASASEMAAIVRRSPDLKRYLNPEIDRPRQALALSTLDDASFGRVLSGEIPAPLAAHVADTVNPKHHATVLDDVARAKPQSIDELRQLLDELPPREDAEPLLKSGASGIDDPAGPKAKAQLEAMKVDQAAAIEEATAALKERDKIASKVEGLQGEVAKLVDKPDLSEADAMKLAKARAELAELEPQLERLKADTSPDQAGAQAMYRIAMMAYHQRREADVFRAVNHALELARKITPSDTKIEVKPELRQDGIVLDAASDIDTGNIALAIRAVDPDARMGHEALHTLVTKGLISPAEVAELAALARENGTFANEAKYREAYADRPNLERQIEEEAAASYVEAVVRGDIKQAENTIANRVKDFIERIKNLLKGYGFKTRDDIVTALLNGDMARREPVRQWMRENDISALAVRPDAGVMMALGNGIELDLHRSIAAANPDVDPNKIAVLTKEPNGTWMVSSPVGNVAAERRGNAVRVSTSGFDSYAAGKDLKGRGYGLAMYLRLVNEALSNGLIVESDTQVSKDAQAIYAALRRRGYQVEQNPAADVEANGRLTTVRKRFSDANYGKPVFTVTGGPVERRASSPNLMFALADRETGQSMRRDMDALGYVSQALEAARALKQAKGTPEQMLAQLRSAGVKQAEIEATNLGQFLDGKKSVTRDEIVAHLEANRVDLREVRYGTGSADQGAVLEAMDAARKSATDPAVADELGELSDALREGYFTLEDLIRGRNAESSDLRPGTRNALEQIEQRLQVQSRLPKWSSYSLDPSNPTYRETVLHLPESRVDVEEMRKNVEALRARVNEPGLSFDEMLARRQEADRASSEMAAQSSRQLRAVQSDFRSGHFSEPNIIGHMMTSMTKHEGQPVYTIDQIQSDWGQKLRDGGVRDEAKIAELERRLGEAQDKLDAGMVSAPKGDPYAQVPFGYDRPIPAELNDIYQQVQLLGAELETAKQSPTGHPLVNTTDQWTVTTLRRALRQAAEADASYIAIPHGDTVLSYNPEGTEGPEGMRKFYGTSTSNAIVPKNLRNIIQKLDKDAPSPIRVKMLETPTRGMANRGDLKISDGGSDFGFTLFPLTDKIKQEVTQRGQVMFAFAGPKATTARRDMLKLAERMESKGRKPEHIFKQTGWFRGHDKLWRFEIDDSNALLQDLDAISKPWTNRPKDAPTGKDLRIIDAAPLKDVLDHPALFAAYPFLEKMPVRVIYGDSLPAELNQTGKFSLREIGNRRSMSVTVRGRSVIEVHRALLHELQHYIQTKEGWDAGASPKNFTPGGIDARRPNRGTDLFPLTVGDRMVLWHEEKLQELQRDHAQGRMKSLTENDSLRSLNKSAAEQMRMGERGYSKSPGEAEANLTMERGALTAEERRDAFPMAQWPRDLDPAAPVQFSKWRPAIEAAQDALARTKGYRKRYFAPQMVGDRTRMSRLEQANLVEDRINFDWLGSDGTPAVRVEVREYPFSGTAEYMGERILRDYSSNSSDEAVSIMALQPAERAAFVDDIERGLRERNLRMVVNTERMDADEAAWWWSRNEANGDQDPRRFISDVEDALYEKHGNGVVLKPGNGYGEDWSFSVTGMLGRKKKFKTEEFGVVEDVWLDGDELWGMINAARKRRGEISRDDVANEYRGIDRAIIDDMRRDDKGGLVMFAFSGFKKPVDRSDRMAHVVMRRLTDKNGKTFLARVVEQGEDLRIEMYGDRSPETPESELSRGASRHGPLLGSVDLSYQGIGRLATHGHRGPLYEVQYVTVDEKQRMRGLAKATYDMIEEMLGTEMAPSGTLLPDGYAHWKKRNPELVRGHQYHREFEQYMSPRNIKYQLDSAERAAREFNREAEIDGHIGNLRARFERNLRALIAQGVDEDAIRNGGTDAIEKALSESRIDFASGDLPWTVKDALRRDGRDAAVKVLAKEIDLARFRTADGPARDDAEYLVDERAKSNRQKLAILRGMWRKVPADLRSEKARQAMFAFAGERAKTADLEALARAKKMTADGVDRTKIWQDTGWFLGVDGKWKWEIDDSGATFTNAPLTNVGSYLLSRRGGSAPPAGVDAKTFGEALRHPELYSAYPDMAGIEFSRSGYGAGGYHVPAMWNKFEGRMMPEKIGIEPTQAVSTPRSVALHEGQHAVQDREAFSKGGSASEFTAEQIAAERARMTSATDDGWTSVGTYDPSITDRQIAIGLYNRLAGEVEARAVQKRMNLTPEERRARPPWMDYDVPEDQQIVRFADGSGPMFAFAESTPQSRAKVSEEIKRIINDRTQRQPGERLGTGEQDSGPGARQARFGRALDGQPDPSLGRGQSAQGPSAEGATGAGESRLPVTEILRNAVWDHIGDRLTPEQARSRKEAQGFTINAWHATFKTFDTPDPFRPLRDFGFHVAVGKPDAANERLGFAVTFHAKLDAFVAKVLGVAEKSWYAKRENKGDEARIMALAVKSHNPLRLPDLIQWEMPGQWKEGLNPDNSPAWLRDWVRNWFIDNNAYSITQQQFLAQSHKFSRDVAAELERRGYDGIVYTNKAEAKGQDSLLVWNPAQVRSAFDAFDERAANDVGLRASDKYIEQDIRAIANRVMQEEGLAQPNLMFAMADTAQPEPPKRPIEQDYAVIDRLQKMNELIEACR